MSSSVTYIVPPPARLDTFRAGEVDERAIDFSADLTPYSDTIASIISVEVVGRDDGTTLGAGDLAIITNDTDRQIAIDISGTTIGWWQTSSDAICSSGTTIDYQINLRAMTTKGRTIMCDAMQLVVPARG